MKKTKGKGQYLGKREQQVLAAIECRKGVLLEASFRSKLEDYQINRRA
ncbi:hypothetical protein [Idiomarina loihiensis]